jgi:glycosyltransferase involved in cell wall biosynthesis
MKITIVVGGRWHAFDLAQQLHAHGHLHRLITNYPRWFVMRWGIPAEKVVSLPLTFWAVKAIYKIGGEALMMRCQWWVHRWFAKRAVNHLEGSELIHGWSQWSEPSLCWAQQRQIPTVLERSSAHILEQSRLLREEHARHGLKWPSTHPKIEAMELREYGLCSAIAVPSLFVERSFHERGNNAVAMNRNALGVSLKEFKPSTEPPIPPSQCGLKVIYAGSLSVRKGIPDLLAGFKRANLPDASLTLLGGDTPELEELLNQQSSCVLRLGHRPQAELVMHYQQSHCFVISSIEEGMAMVQMQALACGLPLICTTNTGGEDLLRLQGSKSEGNQMDIQQFPAGFVVPIHRPDAIARCLERLQNEPQLWERMREAALELASRELSWSDYGDRAISHYKTLLSQQ